MQDLVTLFNLASGSAGGKNSISSPTENSREAELCRMWYEPVRNFVLRAAPWSSTKTFARLSVLKERNDSLPWADGDPEPGYRFAYSLPDNFLYPRYLVNFAHFTMGLLQSNRLAIMTNQEEAVLCYSLLQTSPVMWDPALFMAVAYALAAKITVPLSGKDERQRAAVQEANSIILLARTNEANQDYTPVEWVPEWISARGFGPATTSRFIYPTGPMFSVEAVGAS